MIIREWENRPLEDGYTDSERADLELIDEYDRLPFRKKEQILMNNADFREKYKEYVQDLIDGYSVESLIELGILDEVPEVTKRFKDYLSSYYPEYYQGDIIKCMEELPDQKYGLATDEMLDDLMWTVMTRDILIPDIEEQMRDYIITNLDTLLM